MLIILLVSRDGGIRRSLVMSAVVLSLGACGSSAGRPVAWSGTPVTSANVPEGFAVPDGARLLAPAGLSFSEVSGSALLSIPHSPRLTWQRLLARLDRRYPRRYVDDVGCRTDPDGVFECSVRLTARLADGRYRGIYASLRRVPDDVSGGYLLLLRSSRVRHLGDRYGPSESLRSPLPARFAAPSRRRAPRAGELLSPSRERKRYVLLPGSELVAVLGTGNVTGGFNALMRVLPGHDPLKVGRAYARQAAQSREPIALQRRANVIALYPPGEVGGYSGFISVRDAPGDDRDLIMYDLGND